MGNVQPVQRLEAQPLDRLHLQPNDLAQHAAFADFGRRGLDAMQRQNVSFITIRAGDIVKYERLANGAFKDAYLVTLSPECLARELPSGRFVAKVARQGAPENGLDNFTPQERISIVRSDTVVGQVTALVFYDMKSKLQQAGLEVSVGCSRPVLVGPVSVLPDSEGEDAMVEAYVPGEFKKYILQNGLVVQDGHTAEVAAALLHYSYVFSRGFCCVADIQGTETEFTDCCLNTVVGNTNIADAGLDYLKSCALLHKCNDFCTALGINSIEGETTLANGAAARNFVTTYVGAEYASGTYHCLRSLPATARSVRLMGAKPEINAYSKSFLDSQKA